MLKTVKLKSYHAYGIIGFALVLLISLMSGFSQMFTEAITHITNDLTAELAVHAYIAGLLLIFYALYLYKTKKRRR